MSTTLDKTIARAEGFLKRFRDKPVAHLIDGKADLGSGETFETLSISPWKQRTSRSRSDNHKIPKIGT